MNLAALLVCADEAAAQVLRRVLKELEIQAESCADSTRAGIRLGQDRFDVVILDCASQKDLVALLQEAHASRLNGSTLAVAIVPGQESIREIFSLGVNFVLYKPVSYERALASLRAAQALMRKDKRRSARAPVHAHATIEFAGVENAKGTLIDLAEDGMAVHFGKKFPPTSKVYFQFRLPGQSASVRLSGQVLWQDWNGRSGIHFVDVPQTSRRLLHDWLKSNLSDATRQESPIAVEFELPPHPEPGLPASERPESLLNNGTAAARLRSEPGNRRGQGRYACRLGAEVYKTGTSVRNYCHLSDLSPGGCYLEMPLAFPSGTAVEIVVRTHEMKLRLSGEVRASHPGYGMGVSFKLNTKDERQGVQQLIDFVAATAESSS